MLERIQSATVFSKEQVIFHDISYQAFAYPGDEEALAALRSIPGASALLGWMQKNFIEELTFVQNNEHMVRVSRRNYASLHKLLERCCEILSLPVPDLYVTTNPTLNAYTTGHHRTSIVLHSELVEALTVDELSFVIGHELGHIKCAHGLYRTLGDLLIQHWDFVASLVPVPGLALARVPLLLAYWEWYRRAELTCDRAGLLCVQHLPPCLHALGKLAGRLAGMEDEFNTEALLHQAEVKKEVKNKLVVAIAILEAAQNTHPFVPERLKKLTAFSSEEQYRKVLGGAYTRDSMGLHEGGKRIRCGCGLEVNMKFRYCPDCGRPIRRPSLQYTVQKASTPG